MSRTFGLVNVMREYIEPVFKRYKYGDVDGTCKQSFRQRIYLPCIDLPIHYRMIVTKHSMQIQQECIPVGCVPSAAVTARGCLPRRMSAAGGVSQHALRQTCLSCEQNDRQV